jgi:hypothetical protein
VKGTREAISLALLALFTRNAALMAMLPGGVTRRVFMWTDSSPKPVLLLFKGGPAAESYIQPQDSRGGLTKYVITYNLWLYLTASGNPNTPAETVMNNIADQIDVSFQTDTTPSRSSYGELQTLGGLVNNAYIEGGSEWSREFQDGNIVAMWRILVELGI